MRSFCWQLFCRCQWQNLMAATIGKHISCRTYKFHVGRTSTENNIFVSGWHPRENKHFPIGQMLYFWWLENDSKNHFLWVHHIFLSTSDHKDRILDLMANNFPIDNVLTKKLVHWQENLSTNRKIGTLTGKLIFQFFCRYSLFSFGVFTDRIIQASSSAIVLLLSTSVKFAAIFLRIYILNKIRQQDVKNNCNCLAYLRLPAMFIIYSRHGTCPSMS